MIRVKGGKIIVPSDVYSIISIFISPQQVIGFSKELNKRLGDSVVVLDGIRISRRFSLKGTNEEDWENVFVTNVKYGTISEEVWTVDAPDLIELSVDPTTVIRRSDIDVISMGKLVNFFKHVREMVSHGELTVERWSVINKVHNVKVWGMEIDKGTYPGIPSGYKNDLTADSELEGYVVLDILPSTRV